MSADRDREGRATWGFAWLLACLAGLAMPATGKAQEYLIEDGGLRAPAAYDKGYAGESVLVSPAGPGSFESLDGQVAAPGETNDILNPDGSGADCLTGSCTACGGQGCGRCSHGAGLFQRLCGDAWPRWVVQVDALMLWQGNIASGPFTVNGIGKAGAFYNNAYQRTSYTDPAFTAAAATADRIAFFGELGVNGNLRLTDWLSWRLGYSLFWLSGVAVPANQLSTTNLAAVPPAATINANGSVLLHGVTTGLEARW